MPFRKPTFSFELGDDIVENRKSIEHAIRAHEVPLYRKPVAIRTVARISISEYSGCCVAGQGPYAMIRTLLMAELEHTHVIKDCSASSVGATSEDFVATSDKPQVDVYISLMDEVAW